MIYLFIRFKSKTLLEGKYTSSLSLNYYGNRHIGIHKLFMYFYYIYYFLIAFFIYIKSELYRPYLFFIKFLPENKIILISLLYIVPKVKNYVFYSSIQYLTLDFILYR